MIIDKELKERYKRFYDNVCLCNTLIIANQSESYNTIMDLLAMTAGQAIGIAAYMGIDAAQAHAKAYAEIHGTVNISAADIPDPSKRPWDKLGISRSTYYNDLRRSKLADERIRGK
jgi:hypothetical protein